jgi:hypothetical protein
MAFLCLTCKHTSMIRFFSSLTCFYTSLKLVSSTDVYSTRQCMPNAKKWCLTCDLHVSGTFSFPLTCGYTSLKLVSSTDVYSTRQCMPNAKKWCLTCDLHVSGTFSFPLTCGPHVTDANFFYWRVHHTSVASKRIDFAETGCLKDIRKNDFDRNTS